MPQFIKMGLHGTGYMGKKGSHAASVRNCKARRKVLPGYPVGTKFKSIEDVRHYLSGDRITCLLCGKDYRKLGTHIVKIHGVTPDQYREKYGIPWTYGLLCQSSSDAYSRHIKKMMASGDIVPPIKVGDAQNAMVQRPRRKTLFKAQIAISNLGDKAKSKHPLRTGPDGELETFTERRERIKSKRGSKEFKEKMAERPQCKKFGREMKYYWKGREQSEEHINKRFRAVGERTRKVGGAKCQKLKDGLQEPCQKGL